MDMLYVLLVIYEWNSLVTNLNKLYAEQRLRVAGDMRRLDINLTSIFDRSAWVITV